MPLALLGTTVTNASGAPAPSSSAPKAAFGLDALSYRDVTGAAPRSAAAAKPMVSSFSVRVSPSGQTAVVDSSMVDDGALSATSPSFVDLAWKSYSKNARYTVVREGTPVAELKAGSSSFRDTHVVPGAKYQYRIIPELVGDHSQARTFGLQVTVPTTAKGESDLTAMRASVAARGKAAAAASTTTLTWTTFIPEARLAAPTVGGKAVCTYGKGYTFGGDNRGFDWKNSRYRTSVSATIKWSNKSVEGNTSIGATHVYDKNGKLVAKKTASNESFARKLGNGSNYIDMRLSTQARNPFCGSMTMGNAISGAMQFRVYSNGDWQIRSGVHRLMPNHYMYIYNGGRVTDVYKRKYASPFCLVGSAGCEPADLTGYTGHYN
ncbi:hypothetical protein [Streptomyces luteireticuli]|uniref:hypothetical protein n=1 Tax=Streptomyces luteireticuli TaxID=173858 RepID=UPI0035587EF4